MNNLFKIFLLLLIPTIGSCGTVRMGKIIENPEKYLFVSDFEMTWNNELPVKTFEKQIKIDEPFVGQNGFIYILKKTNNDSNFVLEVRIDRNIYDPPYYRDEEHLRDRY
jgi:exosome complex RNA-binding protein Rrp4